MKKKLTFLLTLIMLFLVSTGTLAADQTFSTDVTTASDGCTLLGIQGTYIIDTQAALDRINAIRLEACKEGVPHPSTGEPMTTSDYVPIKWSSDLEYIAKIRAAESSLTMDHVRTNGYNCFALSSPNGVYSYGEVLAWNWSSSVLTGINQWYSEKTDWVNQNANAVTGHYTQMIDPDNLYVGIGTFCSTTSGYYNTTAGEFSSRSGLTESSSKGTQTGIQILEVNNSFLTNSYKVTGTLQGKKGSTCKVNLTTGTAITDYWGGTVSTTGLLVMDTVTWSSANTNTATVDASGNVHPNYCGTVQITGQVGSYKASAAFTVNHTEVTTPAVAATCKSTGLTTGTHCSVCNKVITKQKTTSKTSHSWDKGTVTKEATYKATGIRTYSCTVCQKTKTEKIAKVKIKKGKTFTVNGFKYKITNAKTNGKGTVTLTGLSGKKADLTALKIADTVKIAGAKFRITSIGTAAFKGCTNLTSVTIGTKVTSIGKEAFSGCSKLQLLTIKGKSLKSVGKNAVKSISSTATIKVPSSKVKAYKKLFKSKTGFKKTMVIGK